MRSHYLSRLSSVRTPALRVWWFSLFCMVKESGYIFLLVLISTFGRCHCFQYVTSFGANGCKASLPTWASCLVKTQYFIYCMLLSLPVLKFFFIKKLEIKGLEGQTHRLPILLGEKKNRKKKDKRGRWWLAEGEHILHVPVHETCVPALLRVSSTSHKTFLRFTQNYFPHTSSTNVHIKNTCENVSKRQSRTHSEHHLITVTAY